MVPVRRHVSYWRAYFAGGGLFLAALLVSAAKQSGQQEATQANAYAAQDQNSAGRSPLTPGTFAATPPDPALSWPPAVVKVEPSPEEVEQAAKTDAAEARVLGLEPDVWVALFTLILTISTTLLWVETLRLRRGADAQQATDKAAREADATHLEESLQIARTSADAALSQSKTSEKALLGIERPYVLASDIKGVFHSTNPGITGYGGQVPPTSSVACFVNFRIHNVGRTPATVHEIKFKMFYGDGFPDDPDYQRPNMIPIEIVLGRDEVTQGYFSTDAVEGVNIIDNTVPEGKYLFFYGLIIYSDMFGDIYVRKTAFRFVNPRRFLRVVGRKHNEEKRFDKPTDFIWF